MKAAAVSLEDKYAEDCGRVYLNGLQALVRALINQSARDRHAGSNTAGFVSGYRGSPLGTFDRELWKAQRHLSPRGIRFVPGVNEELAAGAIAGTQQLGLIPGPRHEGVFGLWYGKGPGVDRCGDVFRHGNLAGTAPRGGVLLVCGDDHGGASTTTNHQSDHSLRALHIPLLLPASLQDVLDLSAHGWALSRYSGLYVGLKALVETIETSAVVEADPWRVPHHDPSGAAFAPGELSIRWPDDRWSQERRLFDGKLPALMAYVRANHLNPITFAHPQARLGIIASGKAHLDLEQALADFLLGPRELRELGIRICKIQVPWPLEPASVREFAAGLEEILVIEEKEPLVEPQLRDILFALPESRRPRILGKAPVEPGDPHARLATLPLAGDLDVAAISRVLGAWLLRHAPLPAVERRLEALRVADAAVSVSAPVHARVPYYCSGCPHNTSTKVPEGSLALAGVGCHYLSVFIYPERTRTFSVMGAEGSNWVGLAAFTETSHAFVNLGEGTYFHSGILAIRQAVAAGVNVTYRILYNDAVAMTGGQPVDGPLTVPALAAQLDAEGVSKVVIVAEEPRLLRDSPALPPGTPVRPRSELNAVQEELRGSPGCTVLVYVQTCAAEKRRRRKRAQYPDPARRVLINPEVCEGCGDCATQSNCVSVIPRHTALGVKRAIDQSSCNKDFSCLRGFCPSFVTVEGGALRHGVRQSADDRWPRLPEPPRPDTAGGTYNILITGIGGTGVITIGALLGMAAHLEGKAVSVLDMTGMAQKNGGVQSHVRIASETGHPGASRIPVAAADAVIACDMLEAANPQALRRLDRARTRILANTDLVMPGGYVQHPEDYTVLADELRGIFRHHLLDDHQHFIGAATLARNLLGDSIGANVLMLGAALQSGLIPLGVSSLERAIELNGVAVEANKAALEWGRRVAADPEAVRRFVSATAGPAAAGPDTAPTGAVSTEEELALLVEDRRRRLCDYGSPSRTRRYLALVELAREAETRACPGSVALSAAVARYFHKLLAAKDEYEVARLFTEGSFLGDIGRRFEGPYRVKFHFAPPILARRNASTGQPAKRAFGPYIRLPLRILAKARRVRGTLADPFRWTAERVLDRRLADEYERFVRELCGSLNPAALPLTVVLASLPERVRGYGHVREAAARKAEAAKQELLRRLAEIRAR